MDNKEKTTEELIKQSLGGCRAQRGQGCFDEQVLLDYLTDSLDEAGRKAVEKHLAVCNFCLSQISLAFEASRKRRFKPIPKALAKKIKENFNRLKGQKNKKKIEKKDFKKRFYLFATIFCFILSFFVPEYFLQFLVAALILGIRWSFESKGGQTLIMVLDSWRRQSRDKDFEISNRLKKYFKK